ncbi:MAG: MFS transporter [Defluviitaleaceae bacterium]|nr:MFS transporter [Defluviitaleaceae bacterium]
MTANKRSFYLIVISQGISLIGNEVLYFAISLYILDLTGSAEIFATMVAVSFLPRILFAPLGGALADRFSKKMILVISDSINAAFVTLLTLLLISGNESIILLAATVTLMTLVATGYHPTVTASLPVLLKKDEIIKANGIVQGIKASSRLLGPILAGLLFGIIGVLYLVGLCAVFFVFSAVINVFIKIPHQAKETVGGMLSTIITDIKNGFTYIIKGNPLLFKIAVAFTLFIFFYQAMLSVVLPYMVRITFGMNEEVFGFINASIGLVVIVGSLLSGKLKKYMEIKHLPYYFMLIGIVTVPIMVSVMLPSTINMLPPLLMVSGFMLIMFVFTISNILVMAYMQTHVPQDMIGKTSASFLTIVNVSAPIGLIVIGWLLESLVNFQYLIYMSVAIFTIMLGIVTKKYLRS